LNLDDKNALLSIDQHDMIDCLRGLPLRVIHSWQMGLNFSPDITFSADQYLFIGRGAFEIGIKIFLSCFESTFSKPAWILNQNTLPVWVHGAAWCVIGIMNHQDQIDIEALLQEAVLRGCKVVRVFLNESSIHANQPSLRELACWVPTKPGCEVEDQIGFLIGLFDRWKLIPDQSTQIQKLVNLLENEIATLDIDNPVARNPVKRAAGQLVGRWGVVFGCDYLGGAAQYWKYQLNRIAKTWSQFEIIPGAEYATPLGVFNNNQPLSDILVLFLEGSHHYSENSILSKRIRHLFIEQGINTDYYLPKGETKLEQVFWSLQFGDFLAYYLALANGIDPLPVEVRNYLNQE